MKIKTTKEVIDFAIEIGVIAEHGRMIICKSHRDKKWVAVDDMIKEIDRCFKQVFPEYDELPDGHRLKELKKMLEKSEARKG